MAALIFKPLPPTFMPLIVTLNNGQQITAQRLTSATYPALAALLWDEGEAFPDLNTPEARQRIAPLMFKRLRDPMFIQSLAFALVTIFPDISDTLVWYDDKQKPSFGVAGLELDEILRILMAVSDAIKINPEAKLSPQTPLEQALEVAPKPPAAALSAALPKLVAPPTRKEAPVTRR